MCFVIPMNHAPPPSLASASLCADLLCAPAPWQQLLTMLLCPKPPPSLMNILILLGGQEAQGRKPELSQASSSVLQLTDHKVKLWLRYLRPGNPLSVSVVPATVSRIAVSGPGRKCLTSFDFFHFKPSTALGVIKSLRIVNSETCAPCSENVRSEQDPNGDFFQLVA